MTGLASSGRTVLLASGDDELVRRFRADLHEAGFAVLTAPSGPEAISLFCLEKPALVLLDAELPGGGLLVGRDLLETPAGADACVLAIAGGGVADPWDAASAVGAQDVLPRGCGALELTSKATLALRQLAVSCDLRLRNRELKRRVALGVGELERANRRLKQQLRQQQTLLELTHEMNALLDVEAQANVLLLSIVGQLGVQSAALFAAVAGEEMALQGVKGIEAAACEAIAAEDRAGWRQFLETAGAAPLEGIVPAELAALGFALMVPIRCRAGVSGAISLGPKLTGQPFSPGDLRMLETMGNSFAVALQNAALYQQLQQSYVSTIGALVSAIEAKDKYTRGHTARVAHYARALAVALDLDRDQLKQVEYGAALHDVGKIGMHDDILNKQGRLDDAEFAAMRNHPVIGDRILARIDFLREARQAVRHHHERVDGTGYPDGLKGDQIPLLAKIVCVADAFDAMTTTRPYSQPISLDQAIAILESKAGSQFDPQVVAAFVQLLRSQSLRPAALAAATV